MLASIFRQSRAARRTLATTNFRPASSQTNSINAKSNSKPNYISTEGIPSPKDYSPERLDPTILGFAIDEIWMNMPLEPDSAGYEYQLKSLILRCFAKFEEYKYCVNTGSDPNNRQNSILQGIIGFEHILEKAPKDTEERTEVIGYLQDMLQFLKKQPRKSKELVANIKNIEKVLVKYEKDSTPSPLC
jgi:hypothetical protein